MKKYKLIKEYPGSPELGTEVEKDKLSKSYFYRCGDKRWVVLTDHVEENPEYWEEINDNLWYVVSERHYQPDYTLFEAWWVYKIESIGPNPSSPLHYFKTKEEAELFVINNKPCLTCKEVKKILGVEHEHEKRKIVLELNNLVKSKL